MPVRRIARPLLSSIFVVMGIDAIRDPAGRGVAASRAAEQYGFLLPSAARAAIESNPENFVRANGLVHAGGGILLATGKFRRAAAGTLVASLVPTTLAGHAFWDESDPAQRKIQMIQFLKNLGLAGGLLLAAVDTEGEPALDRSGRRAARRARAGLTIVLKDSDATPQEISRMATAFGYTVQTSKDRTAEELRRRPDKAGAAEADAVRRAADSLENVRAIAASRGDELAATARVQTEQLAGIARKRGTDLAEAARVRGAEWADSAEHHGAQWVDAAGRRGAELAEQAGQRGVEFAELAGQRSAELAELAGQRGAEIAELAGRGSTHVIERLQADAPGLRKRARAIQSEAPRLGKRAVVRAEDAVDHAAKAAAQATRGRKARKGRRRRRVRP